VSPKVQSVSNRYEEVVGALMVRIGVLEDRLRRQTPVASYAATAARGAHHVVSPAAPVVPVAIPRKIRETCSAVVACDDPALSGRQIAEKIRKEVAPALGVRVHEVRELKRGGAISRTPSQEEMSKVVASAKFAEVGLKVSRNAAAKPRMTVQDVDTSVGPDEFMMELKEKNFEKMSLKEFQKAVVPATKPWSAADGPTDNVTLEVDDQALVVLEGGRVYVKWFSYCCRSQVRTYACHRCLGFDHKVSECRYPQEKQVCHQNGWAERPRRGKLQECGELPKLPS